MASTTGRRIIEVLTNKSGGGVIAGDVVVIDTANDQAFTTSTAGSFLGFVGVAQETIANNAAGRVLTAGYAALVNVNASVTRGNFGKTHTVVKQATDAGASRVSGVFCQFLTGGTTPTAHLFGLPDTAGTAGDFSGLTIQRSVQPVSDYAAAYDASAADERGVPLGFFHGGRQGCVIFDDLFFNATTSVYNGGVTGDASGTGAAVAAAAGGTNLPGVITLDTGTTTTGHCGIRQVGNGGAILLGGGKARFGVVAKLITALSDGTDTYTVRMGLHDNTAGAEAVDAVYFRYTHSVNSGKWQAVTRSNSTESTADTGSTADITTWHTFEFEVNAAASSVEYFIDGASVATITTNIPSGAGRGTALMPGGIVKSAGTTARTMGLDAYWLHLEFTTAR